MHGIKGISKKYGELAVLERVSIDFASGGTTCILGPSGCGKTTILKILSGLEVSDTGTVEGFAEGDISIVFQEDRLIPWKTVDENLEFVLSGRRELKGKAVEEYLDRLGLLEYRDYYPSKLSGGMRKRIAILRALLYPSEVMLMDEPFSSVDVSNKSLTMGFFKELMAEEKRTCIIVTHDLEEAIELGNRIVVLSDKPTKVRCVIQNSYIDNPSSKSMIDMKKALERQLIMK